ncbi:MAG TPA: K(+)-transporting ATPase subunit C [Acidimicrobiales bacterium]|nr:K(+)-transporting ATPase subunit C [Acidimicrobiales bacterium]
MRRQLFPALMMMVIFTVVAGLIYPLAVTGVAQVAFKDKADGSLVENADGEVVGSSLIGQTFVEPQYFHPRPSAAGDGYDPTLSSGSNLGPTNDKLLVGEVDDPATDDVDESFDGIEQRAAAYRDENDLADDEAVPVDAVTASSSGLDPHISIANARLQAARVADERGLGVDEVLDLVDDHTDGRALGFIGEKAVNVLELNLALDQATES